MSQAEDFTSFEDYPQEYYRSAPEPDWPQKSNYVNFETRGPCYLCMRPTTAALCKPGNPEKQGWYPRKDPYSLWLCPDCGIRHKIVDRLPPSSPMSVPF